MDEVASRVPGYSKHLFPRLNWLTGKPQVSPQGWAPEWLTHGVAQMSFLGHFSAITRGVIDLRDLVYFLSIMVAFLGANAILIDLEKAE